MERRMPTNKKRMPVNKLSLCLVTLLAGLIIATDAMAGAAEQRVAVRLPDTPSAVVERTFAVFSRVIQERTGIVPEKSPDGKIVFALRADIGTEGYKIADGKVGEIIITGNDERGLLYGVGAFLRAARFQPGSFTPGAWRCKSVPAMPVRGMYFATHFHNFYHDAPLEKVQRYLEDLALWGMNTLIVWYDMHHFGGWDDPAAVTMRLRLRSVLQCGRSLGLDVGFVVVANEGYANSPVALRADPSGARGARFPSDICISKPEGQKYVLDNFTQLFNWAKDLRPGFVWLWPYDSGGCACNECRPWGSNGYLRASERAAQLAKQILPGAKIALATWYFDQAEWKELAKAFSAKPDWSDYLISQPGTYAFSNSSPGGLPILGFPEISMKGMRPWGGFGANPQPRALQTYWTGFKAKSAGGFPYSEGIFEDLNKIICTQFYWSPDRPVDDIVSEYISFEFSPAVVEDTMEVIRTLEQNHHERPKPFPSRNAKPSKSDLVVLQADPGAEEAYATANKVNAHLSPTARKSWRWRILYLRALLDAELKTNGGKANDVCAHAFQELTEIYHAQKAYGLVKPPAPRSP